MPNPVPMPSKSHATVFCIVGWLQDRVYGAFCNTYAFPVAIGTRELRGNPLSEQFNGRVDNTILSTVHPRKSFKTSSKACWQPVTKIKESEETWGNKTVNQFKD